mmetsp:Transcript_106887/g.312495  ORF Transcript_106887/g.312495 Transcript_106887/m.312495 type:complete len:265 (+) Transcript_106887:96-890(+)
MSKPAADVTDAPPEAAPEGPTWTSKACLSAIDGAVVGNTLGFVVGAFPGMCIGAASGGVAGVLGGGLLAPVLRPAVGVAASAMPGKFVLSANGAASSMIGRLCVGPRAELGKGGAAEEAEQSTDFSLGSPPEVEASGAGEKFEEIPEERSGQGREPPQQQTPGPPRPKLQLLSTTSGELVSAKDALDSAMVRASAAGAQGAIAGAEVGGAVVGTALAIPGAVLGSLVGGVVGMCADIHGRYFQQEAPAKQEAPPAPPAEQGGNA